MEPSFSIPLGFAQKNFSVRWWEETNAVLSQFGLDLTLASSAVAESDNGSAAEPEGEWELPDLSPAQARKLVTNVSARLRTTFKVIAESPEAGFAVKDIAQALGDEDEGTLRGVWSGVTRRLRTVLGDEEAYLFQWEEDDESGIAWKGMVSPTTYRSLRKALAID